MKTKRWLTVGLAGALMATILCGCGADSLSDGNTNITTSATKASIVLSEYLPSAEEYSLRILELHPEAGEYLLAAEENGDLIYTDTGSITDYSAVFMTTANGSFMFSKNKGDKQYMVYYDASLNVLLAQTSAEMGLLSDVVRDAAAYIEKYPGAMTADDMNTAFIMDGETNTDYAKPFTTYETTEYGINYQINATETYYMVRLEFTSGYHYTPA